MKNGNIENDNIENLDIKYINSKITITKNIPFEILIPFLPNIVFQNLYYFYLSAILMMFIYYLNKYDLNITKLFRIIAFLIKNRILLPERKLKDNIPLSNN